MCVQYYPLLDRAKFALTVRFHVKHAQSEKFQALIRSRVRSARLDEAVIDFRLFASEESDVFVVFESFVSRAAWTAFSKHPDTAAFLAAAAPMLASPYGVQFLNLVDC